MIYSNIKSYTSISIINCYKVFLSLHYLSALFIDLIINKIMFPQDEASNNFIRVIILELILHIFVVVFQVTWHILIMFKSLLFGSFSNNRSTQIDRKWFVKYWIKKNSCIKKAYKKEPQSIVENVLILLFYIKNIAILNKRLVSYYLT